MKYLLILLLFLSLSNASVTMCYKNNHSDPSTIEDVKLDGGACIGEKSLKEMKKAGWIVDDMKISMKNESLNYIYILKKLEKTNGITTQKIDYKEIAKNLKKEKLKDEKIQTIENGKKFYVRNCLQCHGKKADIEVRGTSKKLITLSLEEMKDSLWGYQWNEKDNGWAFIMKPYADLIVESDIEAVHSYLQTLK